MTTQHLFSCRPLTLILCLLLGFTNLQAQTQTIPAGSFIVDMGVMPQTEQNAMLPYGMVYQLIKDHQVPIIWSINTAKGYDGVDFTYDGQDFKAGPFIIEAGFRSDPVNAVISSWQAMGVVGITTASEIVVPVHETISWVPTWTLDEANGGIAEGYLQAAGIPETAYNWKDPQLLDCCDDVFVMPHADPEWATHSNLYFWNETCKGSIWAACHAVSALENSFNPADPTQQMNFLSQDIYEPDPGEAPWDENSLLLWGNHDGGTLPPAYVKDPSLAADPIMQYLGHHDNASENGSEQIYIPVPGGGWLPTTSVAVYDADHPEAFASPGEAAKVAFGRAFGDANRGYVMYEGGHNHSGGDPANIAAMRMLMNFSYNSSGVNAIFVTSSIPDLMEAGQTYPVSVSVTGGTGTFTYEWSSTVEGEFDDPTAASTTFTPAIPDPLEATNAVLTCIVKDNCGTRGGFSSAPVTIVPGPLPPVAVDDITATLPNNPVTMDLLANDSDPNLDPLTLTLIGEVSSMVTTSKGVFTNNADGTVTYTPNTDFEGVDSVQYQICDTTAIVDGGPFCDTAYYIITVALTDEFGCIPGQSFITLDTGYADVVVGSPVDVTNPTFALGYTNLNDGAKADFDNTGSATMTVDLTDIIPVDLYYCVFMEGENSDSVLVHLESSVNNSDYSSDTLLWIASSTLMEYCIAVKNGDGARYIRISHLSTNKSSSLYGIKYERKDCFTECSIPFISQQFSGNADAAVDQGGGDQGKATGAPNFDAEGDFQSGDTLYLDVTDVIPSGSSVFFYMADTDDDANPVTIEIAESVNGQSYNWDGGVDFSTTFKQGEVFPQHKYTVTGGSGARYFALTTTSAEKWRIDGLEYIVNACVDGTADVDDDVATTCEDNPVTINVLENDSTLANTLFLSSIVTGPTNGYILSFDAAGTITYVNQPDNITGDVITYEACNEFGVCATGLLTLTIDPDNCQAHYRQGTLSGNADLIVLDDSVDGQDNALDAQNFDFAKLNDAGDTLVLDLTDTITSGNNITIYFADGDDDATAVEGTVEISIDNVTFGEPKTFSTTIQEGGSSVDSVTFSFAGGTRYLRFTRTSAGEDLMLDAVYYEFCGGPCEKIPHDVMAFNDLDTVPLCYEYLLLSPLTNDMDSLGSALRVIEIIDMPTQGTAVVTLDSLTLSYDPSNVFAGGLDSLTYRVCNNLTPAICDTATYYIFVDPLGVPPNEAPIAMDDSDETIQNQLFYIDVKSNDSDPEGSKLNIKFNSGILQPTVGTVDSILPNGLILYQPNPNIVGLDMFEYIVCDTIPPLGGPCPFIVPKCDTALVTINIPNQSPVAQFNSDTAVTGVTTTIDILGNDFDPDSNPITLESVGSDGAVSNNMSSNGGTAVINGTEIDYTPAPGFSGLDTFKYAICDVIVPVDSIKCDTTIVIIYVPPVNDQPVAMNDADTTDEDTPVIIDVVANDDDPLDPLGDIDPTTVDTIPGSGPSNGTVTIDPVTGEVTYTPDPNFNGTDTFEYVVCDDGNPLPSLCDTATVTILVNPVNDPPIAVNDADTTDQDVPVVIDVVANDDDPLDPAGNIDPTTVDTIPGSGPSNGTLTIDPVTGEVTYTPAPGFIGTDAFDYVVCDDGNPLPSQCDTATVTITIDQSNNPPVAVDDVTTTDEDTPVVIDVVGNDDDPNDPLGEIDPTTVGIIPGTGPSNGAVTIDPVTGEVTYTPVPDFNGTDTFDYVVCDNGTPVLCDTATVSITVNPVNDPPIAVNDVTVTDEDTPVDIDIVANDDDPNDPSGNIDPTTVSTIPGSGPANGTVTIDPVTGVATYSPDPGFNGTDTFDYVVCDDGNPLPSQCDTATVTITVDPVNNPPVAVDDVTTTDEDSPVVIDVVGNDDDPNDPSGNIDPTTVGTIPGSGPSNGTVSIDPVTGEITYTPDPNFNGTDTFDYVVCDDGTPLPAQCDTATVTITVDPVNDPPVAVDDVTVTDEDTPVDIDIVANDDDPLDPSGNIDPTTVSTIPGSGPANGTVTIDPVTGVATYSPDPGFNGTDTFDYVVCDDGNPLPSQCDTATVTITVDPVNNPPVAVDDVTTTDEDSPVVIDVVGNDDDPNDPSGNIDPTTVSTIPGSGPSNGTVTIDPVTGEITYTPDPNFNGTDTFDYVVCDDGNPLPSQCDTATITITVDPVNDPPVAVDDVTVTDEDTPVDIDIVANDDDPLDPSGNIDPTTVEVISGSGPANGTVTIDPVTGVATYSPDPGFNGTDSFDYVVCDDGNPLPAQCDTATVTITVDPVNDPPVAVDDVTTTDEDTPVVIDVVGNDDDPNDPSGNIDPTTVSTIPGSGPSNGAVTIDPVTGEITYTPDPDFNGTDTFDYVVCDDGNPLPSQCDTATITITVDPMNDPPVAVDDVTVTDEDTPVDIDIVANDDDPLDPSGNIDPTTVDVIPGSGPSNGTVTIDPVTGVATYSPDPGFNGTDTFDYVVCDDGNPLPSQCDTATVTITVDPVNNPPVAVDDVTTTDEDTPVVIDVVGNDDDPNDPSGNIDPTTVSTIPGSGPSNGAVTIDPVTGEITYTPDPDFNGTDTFDYVVCDDGNPLPAQCDTATVTITVDPVNDPPVAVDDITVTDEDTPVDIDIVANDDDPLDPSGNIDPTTVSTIPGSGPANGTVTIDPVTGVATYSPDPGFNGTDTFDYVVCDDGNPLPSQCDTATVTITVDPVNDPPVAVDDVTTTDEDSPVVIDVVGNDDDPNDPSGNIDPTTVGTIPGSGPSNGTVSIDPVTGEITYTPDPNFNGTDTFDYVVCDDGTPLPSQCDTATITITVDPMNDPPVAVDDVTVTDEDTPVDIDIVTNDDDPLDPSGNIDPTTVSTIPGSGPANGTVTIDPVTGVATYSPDPGFNGTDTFDYVVCDDGNPLPSQCDTATVTITVDPVNDPPVAVDDVTTTDEDSPVVIDVVGNDDDPNDPSGNIDPTTVGTIPGSGPSNGTVSIDPVTGEITYTPDPNFNGTDTFDYVVCDDGTPLPSQCDTATITITVDPMNDPPVAVDDVTVTDEDTPVDIDIVANDDDPLDPSGNIDPTTVDVIPGSGPSNGTVTIDPVTGVATYSPDPGFNGTDTFDYVVCDDGNPLPSQCDTATVTITVDPVNNPPVAVDDVTTTDEDTPVVIDVVGNDDDPNDPSGNIDPTTVSTIPGSGPSNGTVSIDPVTGEITYTPDPDFNGTDTFDYVVCDDGNPLPAQCDTATVTITVDPVNDPPVAVDDVTVTDEDTPVDIDIVANDDDPLDPSGNIDPTTVSTIPGSGPANGTVTIDPVTGVATYSPDPGFNGTDTFDYVVCDDGNPLPSQCDTATVTITVDPVNNPPVAVDDVTTTDEDSPVVIDVVGNDDDPNDPSGNIDPTTVSTIPGSGPSNGTVTIDPVTGEITYTPDPNFNGTDTFDYVVCDDGNPLPSQCDTATITITVDPVNDPPVAVDDVTVTDEDTPVDIDIVANDDDPLDPSGNIDPTTVDVIPGSGPANGTVTIDPVTGVATYSPDPGFNGTDTFDYVVCDDGNPLPSQCDTATVTITVDPVNNPPVAVDDVTTTDEDTPVVIDVVGNDDDPNDPSGNIDPTTVSTIPGSGPSNGTVTIDPVTGEITYTPDPDFNGTDTFDYVVCDDGNPLPAQCDTATITITVDPMNDPPVAVDDVTVTDEDTPVDIDIVANDDDPLDPSGNIDPTTVDVIPGSGPSNGTVTIDPVTGVATYSPDPGFNGTDTFDYVVCDDGNPLPSQCDTATVTITVDPVNDPPVAVDDVTTTDEDTPVVIDVVGNDDDPNDPSGNIDPTTVSTIPGSGPSNGTVSIDPVTGEITYTPDPNFNGTDTFDYVVCDDGNPLPAQCDTATITITVDPMNDPPVAVDDVTTTDEDTPLVIDVAGNDDDPNDPLGNIDPTTVDTIPGSGPSNGTVTIDPVTGEVTYTPDPNFNGTDSFDYVVCDDGYPLPSQCDTATVTITVDPVNDPPIAVNDIDTTNEDTPILIDIALNDDDPNDPLGNIDPTTVDTIPGSGPSNGTLTIDPVTGATTYTPDPGFHGTDSFDYVVCDDGNPLAALCDTATVAIVVLPVNDPPVAVDDVTTTDEETPVVIDVAGNDDDPLDPLGNIDPATVDTIPGSGPSNGTVTINPVTGAITYTPDPDFNGTDSFDYVVCDDGYPLPSQCDTATVTITVDPVNDPPIAVIDADTTNDDDPILIDILSNDDDPNDPLGNIDPTTVETIQGSGPVNGTVSFDPVTGAATYTPDPAFFGTDSFDYLVCDDGNPLPALCDTATVTIVVLQVNDPPVAVDDVTTTDEETPVMIDIVSNDDDPLDPLGNIDPTTVQTIPGSGPANGTVTIDPVTGAATYIPNPDFNGTDGFDYVICDDGNPLPSECDTATVTIVVLPVNDPPIAMNELAPTPEDTPITIDVVLNDNDPNDPFGNIDPTTVDTIPGGGPSNGSVTIDPVTGAVTYTPDPHFHGTDSFDYVVCDDGNPLPALCDTATVTILVSPVNDPPVVVNDIDTTDEETPILLDIVANDGDPYDLLGDIDPTSVEMIPGTGPSNGMVTIDSETGAATYTPDPGFSGTDSFDYVICDTGNPLPRICDTATVTIVVLPVNDPPIAEDDLAPTFEDTPISIDVVVNDDDPNDPFGNIDPSTVTIIPGSGPSNGMVTIDPVTGVITYTPDPNFQGFETFDYLVCDDGDPLPAMCDTATVTIFVLPVNDPPVVVNDIDTTDEDTPVLIDIVANDDDPNDPLGNIDPTSVEMIPGSGPSNGEVSIDPATGEVTYTPDPDFNGTDTFDYLVCDTGNPLPAQCDTATVTIVVLPSNDPPVAVNDLAPTFEDIPIAINVLSNDNDLHDPLGGIDPTSVDTIPGTGPSNGTVTIDPVTGVVTYTPDPGFNGTDTFDYLVCDTGNPLPALCDTATVSVFIIPVNDPPIAEDDIDTTEEDTPILIDIVANDDDPNDLFGNIDPTSVEVIPGSGPSNGTVTIDPVTGAATYTPDPGFGGTDTFDYVVCDTGNPLPAQCDTATVTIVVLSVNEPPVAVDDLDPTLEDTPVTIDVVANDDDPNDPSGYIDPTTVDIIPGSGPSNGTVTIDSVTGAITYTPDLNYYGTDSFDYLVCDNGNPLPALCDTATVTIVVQPVNDPPIVMNDIDTTDESTPVLIDIIANDDDPNDPLGDIDPTSAEIIPGSGPSNGMVTIDPDTGIATYTPNPGFNGTDTFDYVICDTGNPLPVICDTATVTIVVLPVNDPPVAINDIDTTEEDTPILIDIVANDDDPNDPLGDIDPTSVEVIPGSGPSNGIVIIDPVTGSATYTPDPGFNGTDTFDYVICDTGNPLPAQCDTATVTIVVLPVNDPPIALDDSDTTSVNAPVMINVIANDDDPIDPLGNIDPATVDTIPGSGPVNGTLTIDPVTGQITFTPDPGFSGTDSFEYLVCDDGNPLPVLCDTASVTVTILHPTINLAKQIVNIQPALSEVQGNYDVTFQFVLKNTGLVQLQNVSLLDDFETQYGGAFKGVVVGPEILAASSAVNIGNPDGSYTGVSGADDMLLGDAILDPFDILVVTVTVEVDLDDALGIFAADGALENQAEVIAESAEGFVVQDLSDNGSSPETDNGEGGVDDPTPLQIADISSAKAFVEVVPAASGTDGNRDIGVQIVVQNTGNDTIFNIGVRDSISAYTNLGTIFIGIVAPPTIIASTCTLDPGMNPGFDGDTDVGLTDTTGILAPGESFTLMFEIEVNPDADFAPPEPKNQGACFFCLLEEIPPSQNNSAPETICLEGSRTDSGTDPTSTNPGAPGDTGGYNDFSMLVIPIIAVNDSTVTDFNSPVTISVLSNDIKGLTELDPASLDTIPGGAPANGTVTINPDGTFDYVPELGFSGVDSFLYTVCDSIQPAPNCDTATVTIVVGPGTCTELVVKAFLEGPYQPGSATMTTKLNEFHLLPGQNPANSSNIGAQFFGIAAPPGQPYNEPPWNYMGTEGDNYGDDPTDTSYPTTVTDWVLVSIRAGFFFSLPPIWQCAGLLHEDGNIEFPDDCPCLETDEETLYHIVVEHRNHLSVMSFPRSVTDGVLSYDFTANDSWKLNIGSPQEVTQKVIDGKFVMYAGNGEQVGGRTDMNSFDNSVWINDNGRIFQYLKGDHLLDSDVNSIDRAIWIINNGQFQLIPY